MSAARPPTPDGEGWTPGHSSRNGASAGAWSDSARRLVVLGYITAVAMPLIGLIVGIVIAIRPTKAHSRHGVWIIGLSIIASVGWLAVFASGALTASSNDLS